MKGQNKNLKDKRAKKKKTSPNFKDQNLNNSILWVVTFIVVYIKLKMEETHAIFFFFFFFGSLKHLFTISLMTLYFSLWTV